MQKNEQLDIIYSQIIQKYESTGLAITSKIKDGIVNEDVYEKQKIRILFIVSARKRFVLEIF
jgi:hypothetical protein